MSVSKIGHCDAYHLYETPNIWEQIDAFAETPRNCDSYDVEVEHEYQYHENDYDK